MYTELVLRLGGDPEHFGTLPTAPTVGEAGLTAEARAFGEAWLR